MWHTIRRDHGDVHLGGFVCLPFFSLFSLFLSHTLSNYGALIMSQNPPLWEKLKVRNQNWYESSAEEFLTIVAAGRSKVRTSKEYRITTFLLWKLRRRPLSCRAAQGEPIEGPGVCWYLEGRGVRTWEQARGKWFDRVLWKWLNLRGTGSLNYQAQVAQLLTVSGTAQILKLSHRNFIYTERTLSKYTAKISISQVLVNGAYCVSGFTTCQANQEQILLQH